MRLIWVGLIFSLFFSTCQEKQEDKGEVLASVYGKNLYRTDLDDIFYEGISYNDSVLRSKVYIDKWVRNQLLVRQAENNLEPEQLDFSKRLEEYRNSLVINKYETELIKQNLDTKVTEDQIQEYYNENSDEFRLNRDIVRIATVNLPRDSKKKWLFIKLLRDYDSIMIDSVTSLSKEYALEWNMDVEQWHNFDEVAEKFKLNVTDNKSFLNENKYYVVINDDVYSVIRFCEYRLMGDVSPCEIEVDRIKYIILSNRKKDLLEKLYDDLYSKAVQENAFDVF
jgi:hypothetical protein